MDLGSIAAFFMSLILGRILVGIAPGFLRIDVAGERSLHRVPTPRGGGISFLFAIPVGFAIHGQACHWSFEWRAPAVALAAAVPVAVVGLLDDARESSAWLRIAVHLVVALTIAACVRDPAPAAWMLLPGALGIAWTINLANFMDGADGFLASEALLVFIFMWIASAATGSGGDAVGLGSLAGIAAAGLAGFLVWNLPKARIFMGDVGSGWIGTIVGAMTFGYLLSDPWIAGGSVALAAPFIADASVCVLRRIARRERVWLAHSMHGYQHLVRRRGGSHAALLLGWTSANLLVYLPLAFWVTWHRSFVALAIATALGCLQAVLLGSGLPFRPRECSR